VWVYGIGVGGAVTYYVFQYVLQSTVGLSEH
jgi:hypothetical protein